MLSIAFANANQDNNPDTYGWLRYDERNPNRGICYFKAQTPEDIDIIHPFSTDSAACAGEFANGKYYTYLYAPNDGQATPLTFGTVDLTSGRFEQIADYRGLNTLFSDMAYDYSTATMFAIGSPNGASTSYLLSVDLTDGTINTLANLGEKFCTLACSYEGQLYAIKGNDGYLYTISKTDGSIEEIGYTFEEPEDAYLQSMAFDHATDILYWAGNNIYEEGFFATVDLETGESFRTGTLGNNAQVVGLYIPFERIQPNAPTAITDFTVIPATDGALAAILSWINPATTVSGSQLTNIEKIEIYRNDQLAGSISNAIPGEASSYTDESVPMSGTMKYRVIAINEHGNGASAEVSAFVGRDRPSAPIEATATKISETAISIAWKAPTTGLNGGWIDQPSLTYSITRQPDGKIIVASTTTTAATDSPIDIRNNYFYEVQALTADGSGGTATTNTLPAGPALKVPYFCNFADDDTFALWTVVDANHDSYSWRRETTLDAAYYYYNEDEETGGDDWLISSPIHLSTGKKYRLSFKLQSYDVSYPEQLEVWFGQGTDIANLSTKVGDYEVADNNFVAYETFLPAIEEDGDFNIGFHCVSDPAMFILYLTDVSIEEVADGTLSGTVTTDNAPLQDVTVSIADTALTATTDASGNYTFEKVPEGNHVVSFERIGFETVTLPVDIESEQASHLDAEMTPLPSFSVSGTVVNEEGLPVDNATISLTGYGSYHATTNSSGSFQIEKVFRHENYQLNVNRYGLATYTQPISVTDKDLDIGQIELQDKLLKPYGLTVETTDKAATLTWQSPIDEQEFRHDNGIHSGRLGKTDGTEKSVYGSVFRTPTKLTGMTWYTENYLQSHPAVNIFVFDLDSNGEPTSTILYSQSSVPNTDNRWTGIDFPSPVDAPNGYLLAISANGHVGLGLDDASDERFPFEERTNCYADDYTTGEFTYTETHDIRRSLMIRGIGILLGQDELPTASSTQKYDVWRMKAADSSDRQNWTLLTPEPQSAHSFVDDEWTALPQGFYRYAVQTVYADSQTSEALLTESLANKMLTQLHITIGTNTTKEEAEGISIALTNNDGDSSHTYQATTDGNGSCQISDVWKGAYTIRMSKHGFTTLTATDVDLSTRSDYGLQYELQEYVVNPFNLEIRPTEIAGQRLFQWNRELFLFDDFEVHEDFAINSPGKIGWTYIDGDNEPVMPIDGVDYPNATSPMAFMVFNPFATDPVLGTTNPDIRAHSGNKFLAGFPTSQNNDFIISPKLNYDKDFTFKFFAKSFNEDYGKEKINVGYSLSGNEMEDFEWINGETPIELPMGEWQEYRYTIPAAATYAAINCVSDYLFLLMIDDIFIGIETPDGIDAAAIRSDLTFEVWLDGEKAANTDSPAFLFSGLSNGTHHAGVKALFKSATTPLIETEFTVNDEAGTGNILGNATVQIYPNPTKDIVHITGSYERTTVYNATGQKVGEYAFGQQIDLSGQPAGIYVVQIQSNETQLSRKLVLTR